MVNNKRMRTERAFSSIASRGKVLSATEINNPALCLLEMTKELGVNLNVCLKLSWACKRPWFYILNLSLSYVLKLFILSQRASESVRERNNKKLVNPHEALYVNCHINNPMLVFKFSVES